MIAFTISGLLIAAGAVVLALALMPKSAKAKAGARPGAGGAAGSPRRLLRLLTEPRGGWPWP